MYEVNSNKLVTVNLPLTKSCWEGKMTDFTEKTYNCNLELLKASQNKTYLQLPAYVCAFCGFKDRNYDKSYFHFEVNMSEQSDCLKTCNRRDFGLSAQCFMND
jgi:hypothetical protein